MEINYDRYYNSYLNYNNILFNEKSDLKEISLQFYDNDKNKEFLVENVELGKKILDGAKDTLFDPNSSIELIQGYKQILLELSVFNNNPKKTTHDKNQLMIKLGEILSNLENNNSNINLNPIVPNVQNNIFINSNVVINNSSTNFPQVISNLENNSNNSSTNLPQVKLNLENNNYNSRTNLPQVLPNSEKKNNNSKRDPLAEERRQLLLDAVKRRRNKNSFKSKSTLNSNNNNSQKSLSTSSNSNNLPKNSVVSNKRNQLSKIPSSTSYNNLAKISVESNKRNQLSDSSLNCNELVNEIINNNCNEEENGNLIKEIFDNLGINKKSDNNNQSNNLSSLFEKLKIINNPGQGDCLFMSFETHLGINHMKLRQQSVDWVYRNWDKLSTPNILNSSTLEPIESREEYRNFMSVSGNWGDELSIEALSKFHNITVKVIYHNDNGNLDLFPVFNPGCRREYYLYFQKEHHYQAAI